MEAMIVPAREEETVLHLSIDDELDLLAFELWQRASCEEVVTGDNWVDAEESILIPH